MRRGVAEHAAGRRDRRMTMKLVTFSAAPDQTRVGALVDDGVVDLTAAGLPQDMVAMIAAGPDALAQATRALGQHAAIPRDRVRLRAPVLPPNNVMAVGRNYRAHATEFTRSGYDASERSQIPDDPIIFTKARTSIIGPDEPIVAANDPLGTTDYEGELAVVIGPGGRRIPRERAHDHVFGYTIVNDVTARDLQKRHVQFFIGKSVDTFCPMGPALVTRDEVPDVERCWLRTRVNGELRQESQISALIFDIPTLIATLSEVITLQPGDVIATGTPKGVGMGQDPPRFLAVGDVVEIEIDGIGVLRNPVA
jgi:2-keto-4-pentenoate hydratase/2-oxohepta-3-ene-1,7-dioic acid hydratase in catechol pathway